MKMYAIVDDGYMDGDSAYYCPTSHVEYTEGMTLEDIREAYLKTRLKEEGFIFADITDEEWADEESELFSWKQEADEIQVAWVVDQKSMTALEIATPECYNDGAVYASNRTMKAMAKALSIKIIED